MKRIWQHKLFYLFMLPGIVWFFLFSYVPLYGIQVAFRDYTFVGGFTGVHGQASSTLNNFSIIINPATSSATPSSSAS